MNANPSNFLILHNFDMDNERLTFAIKQHDSETVSLKQKQKISQHKLLEKTEPENPAEM